MQIPPSASSQFGKGKQPASFLPTQDSREREWKQRDRRRHEQDMELTALSRCEGQRTWQHWEYYWSFKSQCLGGWWYISKNRDYRGKKSSWEGRCHNQLGTYLLNLVGHLCKRALQETFIHLGRKKWMPRKKKVNAEKWDKHEVREPESPV